MTTTAPARLHGVLSPVLTPFEADLSPSLPRFVRHCRWLLAQGVGLAPFGTNSEASSLAVHERQRLLEGLLEAGIPAARLMPGTGACAVPDAVALTRHAVRAGCAGVLMLPPYYYKGVGDEGLYRYFAGVIESVADERLRVYLYHIPPVAQVGISLPLVERLLKAYPRHVAGVKDSSGDWSNTQAMLRDYQPHGFDVFAGSEALLLATLRAGGAGCITATGNVNPGPIVELFERWRAPDAEARQAALVQTRHIFQQHPMIAAMKAAIAWQTGDDTWGRVRPPLVALGAAQRQALQAALQKEGFTMPDADMLAAAH